MSSTHSPPTDDAPAYAEEDVKQGLDVNPVWAVNYLINITFATDTEWEWESAAAVGWAVGYADTAVLDWLVKRTDTDSESWATGILKHVAFAGPDAGITLIDRLLQPPDTRDPSMSREDLTFLRSLERLLKQDMPKFPRYWEPQNEPEYEVTFTDDQLDQLLEVLGETNHPKRLRKFDEQFKFNLRRAADEYGPNDTG